MDLKIGQKVVPDIPVSLKKFARKGKFKNWIMNNSDVALGKEGRKARENNYYLIL